jgi:hypothetical protein
MSYPDLMQENEDFFFTETQKDIARIHKIDRDVLSALWQQTEYASVATKGLALSLPGDLAEMPEVSAMPALSPFCIRDNTRADHGMKRTRAGFTLELWLRMQTLDAGQEVLDNRTHNRQGFCLRTTHRGTLEIVLNDGRTENRWDSDPGALESGKLQHVIVTVDGGPNIITFVIDGKLNDGGTFRQFGWGRFSPHLRGVVGAADLRIAPSFSGNVHRLRIYTRALTTSEAVGNYKAGLGT